jgi:Carboxypeptidase regulatory-like domain
MQTFRVVLLSALTLAIGVADARAQVQMEVVSGEPIQIGPQGRPPRTGTGRIRGRVVSAEAGTPVRRAQVRISGTDVASRTTMTDADGRYEFVDLPDGRFNVTSTKAGYVSVQYGQTRPFESGKPIELADKQVVDKADISMPRGSVIVGRIVDEFGEPVADAIVTAMRQQWAGGRRRLVNAGRTAQTNDLGQFRMYGLPPGDYFVSATVRNMDGMMFDLMGATPAAAPPRAAAPSSGYAPTYYPGTAAAGEAQKLTLAAGQEAQGIDFPLLPVRLARITGIVLNSEGRPAEGTLVSAVPGRGLEGAMMMIGGGARTNREGAFTLSNVAPGDYVLQVRGVSIFTSGANGDNMMVTTRIAGPGDGAEFAAQPIVVSGEDLTNVLITTTKGATATGKVTFEGDRPASANNLRVTSSAPDLDGPMLGGGMSGATVKADGTFELKGLSGSPRLLRVNGLPNGWTLKAVEANGIDVTDTGIDFKGSDTVSGIEIILSPKATEITGGVTGADGAAVKDYTLVIFAEDPQKWTVPSTRWITGTRPDQDGRFRVRNMPAGAYYAVAVEYVPQGEWNDPEMLERLKAKAQHFSLGEGESKTLDLKMAGGA